jgi:hypothetical protein
MPALPGYLGEFDASLDTRFVEQAQFDMLCCLSEQGEVGTRAVIRRTERKGLSGPDAHENSF